MIATAPELQLRRGALPKRVLGSFLREAAAAIRLKGEISVLLTTDAHMRELNRQFLRKNKPTDVLSFPAAPGGRQVLAGDLAVSVETAERQAAEFGHGLLAEVEVLLLHGLLHLAGFDHEQDRGEMALLEQTLRAQLRLPLGLLARADERREQ